jgi:hypothetical protein
MIDLKDELVKFFRERAESHINIGSVNDNKFVMLDFDESNIGDMSTKEDVRLCLTVDSRYGGYTGSVVESQDGQIWETLQCEVMVIKYVPNNSPADYVDCLQACKTIVFDIISYMRGYYGAHRCYLFLKHFNWASVRHYRVGPLTSSNFHGWAFRFEVKKKIDFSKTIDTDIWINEP